jgi:group II intron reverse transcriptase/maturase
VDIQAFYDTLDKGHLREFLQRRVRDGALLRLIGKWLNAGVLEQGSLWYPEAGTPQGGVISPTLSNVYLHEVVDVWFAKDVKPRLKGQTFMIRWADDMVIGFTNEEDARRVMNVLPKRFGKYGLTLHPDKTRLIDFRRPSTPPDQPGPGSGPRSRTFDLLGFTHHWAKSRKGYWVIKQKTAKDRFSRAVRRLAAWCRQHRHWSIHDQHEALAKKLRGHCAYYGITGNSRKLQEFRNELMRRWHQWLNRRSQRNDWPWERFKRFLDRNPFPPATPIHSTYRHVANP